MAQIFAATGLIVIGLSVCAGYFLLSNFVLDSCLPGRGENARRNLRWVGLIRPWLFLLPALVLLLIYLVYPVFQTLRLSVMDVGGNWVGFDNYVWLARDDKFRESLGNNILWLMVVPAVSTALGLMLAGVTNRIRWGGIVQSLIFMPMVISFVSAAVIWKFVYAYRGTGQGDQVGLLNAIVTGAGGAPQAWIATPIWNTFFLMAILIWIQTGFAMVVLSAALKTLPVDTQEAARLDGAGTFRIFVQIQLPQIRGMIAVVWTTITVTVLKVFDIVFAMTNGQWGTQVLANLMYDWMFRAADPGRASAVAVVIMFLVTPVMVWMIRSTGRASR
ncbi:carbohydrate ABC transporter permease [Aliiroseovarius crassostreae]|uniref:carbohydrate ABC transporter permease n=1 Tax=Aliiroseovarius crassostreae TaxID=154981 RepID=UPI002202481E|nr:sugar ABC transporter permease [Aliiroseovarius crassostreae]UWP97285.1 sugar ABC transporter permease [Aliiroseovarius crassostreae]